MHDLRHSLRSLARQPGLTVTLLLTIALGIGSNAAVFGFVRGLVTPALPVAEIDTVVSLFTRDTHRMLAPVSYAGYLSVKASTGVFESIGAARKSRVRLGTGGRTVTVSAAAVTPELAGLLQVPAVDGVVISDRLRRTEFARVDQFSGLSVPIDGIDALVAGVASPDLEGLYAGRAVDVWIPLREDGIRGLDRTSRTFSVIGRLRDEVSREAAQAAVDAVADHDALAVLPYTGLTPEAASGMSRLGTLLPVATGAVFLIACANVAAFLLGRASARAHETSVRVALGAGRGRLARQLLADSLLISGAGGVLGVLLALWTAQLLPALLYDVHAEHLVFSPDAGSILGAAVISVVITVDCGMLPLFETRDDHPAGVLRREAAGPSKPMLRLRAGLIVAQMTCCCILAISTGLLFESLHAALRTAAAQGLGQAGSGNR